ncbi:MAG: OmpH family outer membrane protein [Bdellovibrionaceae bacterium]|nr:OmpH family outer membrane protein [Pseudobdellovibrionaceae bacterium]MDW8189679.1 OmpH family outer membrane protein [Pseudobdellovibrionaceae bacterium]
MIYLSQRGFLTRGVAVLVVMGLTLGIPWSALGNIGYVDMQKAIQSTQAGKKAKETLDSEFQKRKQKLDKKKNDIEAMGKDLEKKRNLMTEEALQKRQMEIQEEMMRFQKEVAENQLEIQKKEEELVKPIIEKMKRVIDKVAKEKNLSMVIENKGQVLYAREELDITEDVVKAFEKEKN